METGKRVAIKFTHAEAYALMLAKGVRPSVPYPGSLKPWPGVCIRCGQPVNPTLARVNYKYDPCPYCAGQAVDPALRLGKCMAVNFEPSIPWHGNNKKRWPGICTKCGSPWSPHWSAVRLGNRCRRCQGKKIDDAIAFGTMLAGDFLPSTPFPGGMAPWPGVCLRCGMPGKPRYDSVKQRQGSCGYCSHRWVDDAITLGTMLAADFQPDVPFPGTNLPWRGHCLRCGCPGSPTYGNVRGGAGPCQVCAVYGFDPTEPGWLYLMERPGEQMTGITNDPEQRTRYHAKRGYTPLDWAGPMNGRQARSIETKINQFLRVLGTTPGTKEEWSTAVLEVSSLHDLFAWAGRVVEPSHD